MTRSYALLAVSKACYDEIREKLDAAGYQHCFRADGKDHIIMDGIGLTVGESAIRTVEPLTALDISGCLAETSMTLNKVRNTRANVGKTPELVLAEAINKFLGLTLNA